MSVLAPEAPSWEKITDDFTSSILVRCAIASGEPEIRVWALDHAAEVDAKRGAGHDVGRSVLRTVLATSIDDYFVRGGLKVPGENETAGLGFVQVMPLSKTELKVVSSVMAAFGMQEGEGVSLEDAPIPLGETRAPEAAIARFDFRVPGANYVRFASQIISWKRSSTLFI